jgi:hypothetical protein
MTTTAPPVNGRARPVTLAPLRLPVNGPARPWPGRDDPGQPVTPVHEPGQPSGGDDRNLTPGTPGRSRTAADRPRHLALMTSAFRRNWWRLVFATVGAVAAVVSYGHIVNLFLSWHAPSLDAHLMPVAIDGLIIIGAGAARSGQVWLGWSAIGPGLAASLYANVMNGLPHGYGPAMGSGWATVALFLATNVMERWKAAPAVTPREDKVAPGIADRPDSGADNPGDSRPGKTAGKMPSRKVMSRTGRDRAADIIRRNPGWDNARVAGQAGCDVRTVRRARNSLAGKGTS